MFLIFAIFILGLIFVLSLFINKPGLFVAVSSVGIVSFISFMKSRSLLLSGELFPIENMVQIRAFNLQSGFYLAVVLLLVIMLWNVIGFLVEQKSEINKSIVFMAEYKDCKKTSYRIKARILV